MKLIKMKKVLSIIFCLSILLTFCACGTEGGTNATSETNSKVITDVPDKPQFVAVSENGSRTDDAVGFQLKNPEIGEKIVVFETSMGNIYMRLFPNSAPITVTNFVGLVENNYYNGITFHRVINDFMLQGGDPEGTGRGGDSVWGQDFEDEFNANLLNIRGAVSMANAGPNTNGSQFFINQNNKSYTKEELDYTTMYNGYYTNYKDQLENSYKQLSEQYGTAFINEYPDAEAYIEDTIRYSIAKSALISDLVPAEVWELYKNQGGNITLDGAWKEGTGHSVFAQVFKGMDVVDSICKVEVDSNDKPLKDVVIIKAYTTTVTEEMINTADNIN